MKQISTILVVVFAVVIVGLVAAFYVVVKPGQQGTTNTPGQTSTLPNSNPQEVTPGTTQTQETQNNEQTVPAVKILDPKKDAAVSEDPANKGYYYYNVASSSTTKATLYTIEYIDQTQFFNIILNQEPIAQARKQAQQYLASRLGITEAQLCNLNYMVSVPYKVNEYYSSMNLGFEGCAGSAEF